MRLRLATTINCSSGIGIMAANGTGTNESVTIQNSSIHDVDYLGIAVGN